MSPEMYKNRRAQTKAWSVHFSSSRTRCFEPPSSPQPCLLPPPSFINTIPAVISIHPQRPLRHPIHHTQNMEIDTLPVPDFLAKEREENTPAELEHFFLEFEELWERRLWHQLTSTLDGFFKAPESGPQRLNVFKNFVLTFSEKINQLKLVELGLAASQQCKGTARTRLRPLPAIHLLTPRFRCQWPARLCPSPRLPPNPPLKSQLQRQPRRLRLRHR